VELQHINVKLLLAKPERIDLEALIPIFHGWIQDQVCEELLLDVADYQHCDSGPGIVLIGHQANYSVDNTDGRLGVRYNRKAVIGGNNKDRLMQAARGALSACQRLEADPRLNGTLRFNGHDVEVFINDRLLVPNTNASREVLDSELRGFFQRLFGEEHYALSYDEDPRRLFSVAAKALRSFGTADLLNNLVSVPATPYGH
jgi:hypothetical protein